MAKGLNSARNPSSIANEQHNDATGSERSAEGDICAIQQVISPSTTATPIPNQANLRVCNTNAAYQYLWVGDEGSAPVTVDASNGIALPPGYAKMVWVGSSSDDKKSLMVKASHADVQVVLMKL